MIRSRQELHKPMIISGAGFIIAMILLILMLSSCATNRTVAQVPSSEITAWWTWNCSDKLPKIHYEPNAYNRLGVYIGYPRHEIYAEPNASEDVLWHELRHACHGANGELPMGYTHD